MQIIGAGGPALVVAEDGRFVRLMGLIGLVAFAAVAIVAGIVAGSLIWAEVTGAWLLATLLLILYVHSERWEFDRTSGIVTRTKRLLLVFPLRRRWSCADVGRIEVEERANSDDGVDRAIVLHTRAGEAVRIAQLGALDGEEVQALAGKIRDLVLGAGRPSGHADPG